MAMQDPRGASGGGPGLTALGKLLSLLLIAGLIGLGVYVMKGRGQSKSGDTSTVATNNGGGSSSQGRIGDGKPTDDAPPVKLAETETKVKTLDAAQAYKPKGDTIDIELSEYAGYAGLIVANGGLAPNENSVFFKKHGFKVNIKLSEEESWSKLNRGEMAASATTADVLAVYGRQFKVVVPAQIGFSRGADGVVVKSDISRINYLKGRTLVALQWTEADFFIRYLAQEAGLGINMLADLSATPDASKINLVYADDGPTAGSILSSELEAGRDRLAGAVMWAPVTTQVVDDSKGKAKLLTTNKNLLIIADVLIVNEGFAKANPKMVAGLVEGLLEGNQMVRDNPAPHLDTIAKVFNTIKDPVKDKDDLWTQGKAKAELAKVHLSNLPENLAFFSGAIDAAGSFGGIYQSAVYAYGKDLIPDPPDAEKFLDLSHLKALEASGQFKDQKVAIAPIGSGAGGTATLEQNPLLSKDIRFFFLPNSSKLDMNDKENLNKLASIKELLKISPGSTVLLRGHVDDAMKQKFLEQGGEDFLRKMQMSAVQLSKDRAAEIKRLVVERHQVDPSRVEVVGRGWDEPVSKNSDENRRVEVQWFLVE
jgi:NitT/TauT family transport system substrate-binding protein